MKSTGVDKKVLKEFSNGDISAFTIIYQYFYQVIYFFARNFVDNDAQAQDIVTESFLKLWRRHPDFENTDAIKAFLYTTTRNACLDFLRFEKRSHLSHKEIIYLAEKDEKAIDYNIINAEVIHELQLQVNDLPRQCGEVFKLAFYEGMKTEEIAVKLGIARQTVLNQKAKAVKLLSAVLLKKNLLPKIDPPKQH